MRPETRHALDRICVTDLFSAVGVPIVDQAIVQVASWEDAVSWHHTQAWKYLQYEMRNRLSRTLSVQCESRFEATWNVVVDECTPVLQDCLDKAKSRIAVADEVAVVINNADWNLLNALMEIEYSDIIPVGFFGTILEWHYHGHYPCGWDGNEPPDGRFIIF